MASIITVLGEKLFAIKAQANEPLDIDTFIFANVPAQDPSEAIDRNEGVPILAQQVHTQAVQQVGRINDNVVVFSTVLDSVTGDFDFNWVGLYSSINETLVAINHIPTTPKTKTVPGVAGNTLNRNFGIEYSGIAELTGINVAPETWQLDFTARLAGMDLLTQQLSKDLNGTDSFIGDGFDVYARETLNTFGVLPGVGYVNGLRIELGAEQILIANSYPKNIYVDAYFDGDASSAWKPKHILSITSNELADYVDESGKQHYLVKLAIVTAANEIEGLRVSFNKKEDTKTQNFESVDEFNKSTVEFTNGKQIKLLDRDAVFTKISGVELGNNKDIIAHPTISQSIVINESQPTQKQLGVNTSEDLREAMENKGEPFRVTYGALNHINGTYSLKGIVDLANFAGQTDYGNEPNGFTFHHYTDGKLMVLDNVGEDNVIVRLKNAQNKTRRPDKDSSFVGTGTFISFDEHDNVLGYSKTLGYISKGFEFVFTGEAGSATLWQNKVDDGFSAFTLQTTHSHAYFLRLLNNKKNVVFDFRSDVDGTRSRLESGSDQTNGLLVTTTKGDLQLNAESDILVNKTLKGNGGNLVLGVKSSERVVEVQTPLKQRGYNILALPDATSYNECTILVSGLPAYSNGTEWRYFSDNSAVV